MCPCRERQSSDWRGIQARDQHDSAFPERHQHGDQQESHSPGWVLFRTLVIRSERMDEQTHTTG